MNDLETHVRSVLSDLADGAPPSDSLVAAIHARGRRARRRRLAVTAAAAAVAVLAGGAVAVGLREPEATLQVAAPPPAAAALPPAPVHLGELPEGFGTPRVIVFDTGTWEIWATDPEKDAQLTVSIGPEGPTASSWADAKPKDVTVDGRPAKLVTAPYNQDGSIAYVVFERRPGQWVKVSVRGKGADPYGVVDEKGLLGIAADLTDEPTPVPELLGVADVPAPLTLCASYDGTGQEFDTSQVAYCDPRVEKFAAPLNGTLPLVPENAAVQLYWQHMQEKWWRDQQSGTNRAPIEVAGREGEIAEAGSASERLWYGWVRLSDDVVVNVETREPNLFTRDEFVQFLGGLAPVER